MSTFHWIAFAVIAVMSAARITRLLTFDKFPPVQAVRHWYVGAMDQSDKTRPWQLLALCGYCMGFWVALAVLLWADLAGLLDGSPAFGEDWMPQVWWLVNGLFALAYAAAIVMAYDGDTSEGGI